MLMVQHANALRSEQLRARQRDLVEQMEFITGIPMPRYPSSPTIVQNQPVFNNLKIESSTIGVVNQGHADSIDSSVTVIKQGGNAALADAISAMTEALLRSTEITEEQRSQAVEELAFVSEQATAPAKAKKSSMVVSTCKGLAGLVAGAATLYESWKKLYPLLQVAFPGLPSFPSE